MKERALWWPHLVLVPATLLTLYPVLWVIKVALSPGQAFSVGPSPIPEAISLEHFHALLTQRDLAGTLLFPRWLWNSFVVSAATTVVGIGLSTTAAYGFSRFTFPGRDAGLASLLVSQMFPGVVMAIPLYLLLDRLSLLDSWTGLVLCYSTTSIPFCTWMLKGWFDTLPREIEEAALLDGASRWTLFWRIVLPLSRPALAVTALFSFMTAWNEFILAATFLGSERSFTLPVALQRLVGDYSTDWGTFAAGALLVSLPVVALFYALQRHLVEGLTAGGVKG